MGILDKIFGGDDEAERASSKQRRRESTGGRPAGELADEQAVERYRYLLRTAPPDTIERAHEEAFAQLTPQQRRMVLEQLQSNLPEYERRAAAATDDPRSLARMATRAEVRQPGTLERVFGSVGGGGIGFGGLLAGSFLSSLAGTILGGVIAQQFFDSYGAEQGLAEGVTDQETDSGYAADDAGGDAASDAEMSGDAGGDFGGGDFGDFGEI